MFFKFTTCTTLFLILFSALSHVLLSSFLLAFYFFLLLYIAFGNIHFISCSSQNNDENRIIWMLFLAGFTNVLFIFFLSISVTFIHMHYSQLSPWPIHVFQSQTGPIGADKLTQLPSRTKSHWNISYHKIIVILLIFFSK